MDAKYLKHFPVACVKRNHEKLPLRLLLLLIVVVYALKR